ncbi:MAG: ComEC/Rec2 family competence protein [Candidatus Magasanikbacteria bacterium]|jgi:competence protein ComEC
MLKEGINLIVESKSRSFLGLCFCFILGVAIFSLNNTNYWQIYLFVILFITLFFLIIYWSNKIVRYCLLCGLFFISGGLRFFLSIPSNNDNNISYYNGHTINFVTKVSQEVVSKENSTQVVVSSEKIQNKNVSGKVLLYLPPYSDLKFGDKISVECLLKKPEGSETFINYDKYLARNGVWSQCSWPKILKLYSKPSWIENIINNFYNFKQQVQSKVDELWVEPESALMSGLLYGARASFSAEVSNDFSRTGITHIVAISGYNISIIANILMGGLLMIGLNRRRAFWFAIIGIILFVLFTGASASVVRAGIMGVIVLLATQMGRLSRIGNVLVFTAALMLLLNPFVLVWDAGFQLSFLSTIGLIYLAPIINAHFANNIKNKWLASLKENFISTISAIVITLPLILFQFGRLSIVAPLANMIIIWIIPYLMLVGFVSIILSFIFFPLAQLVAWVAYLGLKYVIIMSHTLASWSLASVKFSVSFVVMIFLYGLILLWIYKKSE